ncbi:MAG: hypothetical protein IK073_04685 [Paludibacteraceae bacterium]|nr:hypothetical protein [Paludibacteraceae bacterium]
MDKEKNVPNVGNEMNFWDLCVLCARGIGRACCAVGRWVAALIRLTYRLWWIVIPVLLLMIGAGYYYTRLDNQTYQVRAIALLNGPSIQQFEQRYAVLQAAQTLPLDEPMAGHIYGRTIGDLRTYRVIDVRPDSVGDYIDFKHKSSPKDTVEVQMRDRLCLQFTMKRRNIALLETVERDMLAFLNADEAMQVAYKTYMPNLQREIRFNHEQLEKLDSLTSQYYFHTTPGVSLSTSQEGITFAGDRKMRLFLKDIYAQHARTERMDYRASLATAPVVLENHFSLVPAPLNSRRRCLPVFAVTGWLLGCALAALIEQRKRLIAWLKQ